MSSSMLLPAEKCVQLFIYHAAFGIYGIIKNLDGNSKQNVEYADFQNHISARQHVPAYCTHI